MIKYLSVILGIFGLEWEMKNHIEKTVSEGEIKEKCGGFLLIRKHHNRGAFLNAGQHKRRLVMLLSVLLTAALTAVFILTLGNAGKGLLKWGLTLLLGGAYSNTYDRLTRKYVVDYVSFPVKSKRFRRIVFNVSDFCIMIGALLLALGEARRK